jgi:hypothetical protein
METDRRNRESIQAEIDFVRNHTRNALGRDVSPDQFIYEIEKIITEKVQDYIFQRFRDWPLLDLHALIAEVKAPRVEAQPEAIAADSVQPEPVLIRRRGRPRKEVGN